ncbi:hypothetical protein Tco_1135056 [Tanacetum coccineum]
MKLNPKKCSFGMEEEKFLGYIVTYEGIIANPEKTKAVMNMPSPSSLKQMQRLSVNIEYMVKVKMDDPNITMDEYIRLEEEKARRCAIVFNDTLTSEATLSCEPTISSLNDNKIDFRISFDESDDEDCTMTTSSTNNSVFRGFFEKQKLTGPNFIDWYRQLRIVLSIDDKLNYLEQPLPILLHLNLPRLKKGLKALFAQQAEHEASTRLTRCDFHAVNRKKGITSGSKLLICPKIINAPALYAIQQVEVPKGKKHTQTCKPKGYQGTKSKNGKKKHAYAPSPIFPPPPTGKIPAKSPIFHEVVLGVCVECEEVYINRFVNNINSSVEETQAPKRTKEQIQQEEASLAEAIRLQTLEEEETAKQVHLDALLAKRLAEEEELTEQQKKRKAQVQFEAQFYTEEDWDAIRAKLEANAELTKDVLGKDLSEQDFAKRMVDLVNQRKKHFAEERAKAKRNKPMTQSQLRIYMSNYLKNQGTWKLSQLKKLKFEEIKEEFEKLVKQIDTFVPINIEATKAQLKRYGEELQTEISKKQRIDVSDTEEKVGKVKEEEPVKRVGKRKKQKARKGISIDKSPQGDSETDKEESVEAMNPTPLDTKSNIVANWKIFQQGERSIYQIIRANGADTVYMSFGAMLKDFTREDLIELYRLVMQKYGTNRPEDAYDRVLWSDLRTMFDPPLNEDAIWSLPLQQKMISWRYYDKCAVHCLTLEACNIYMLADRKYPLSKDACQVMLKMKLLDGKMNEVCYKLLKMIEKQAGVKK